ncbi:MAG: succinate dehydrogenase/fumarate reductase iron-sulfur subunit, partial [Nitrososphaeraceae archaeon]
MSNTVDNNSKNEQRTIALKVYRENRAQKSGSHYDTFEVPYEKWTTVLDALLYVKSYIDPSVAIRYSCRMASCGSCGMKINGIPKLACYTKISEMETSTIECAPLPNFPIIRDLVTDFSRFFTHHKNMQPYIQVKDNVEAEDGTKKGTFSFYQSPEDVDKYLQFSYCIKCGLCNSACPT